MDLNEHLANLNVSQRPGLYWDVRVEESNTSEVTFQGETPASASSEASSGAFIRVALDGRWAFAATTDLASVQSSIEALIDRASSLPFPRGWQPATNEDLDQSTFHERHFQAKRLDKIPLEAKIERLKLGLPAFLESAGVSNLWSSYKDRYLLKAFRSSTGKTFLYDHNLCGILFQYTVTKDSSYFTDYINLAAHTLDDLHVDVEKLQRSVANSHRFVKAVSVSSGRYPVVLAPAVAGVFAHEAFGHRSEADAMLGDADAINAWSLGSEVASSSVTLVDDALNPTTGGYCPIDDEGQKKHRVELIQNGRLNGRLHSQETAYDFGEAPTGNARSMGFEYEPIVRMTNTFIEPGEETLDSLLERAEGGIYVEDYMHGSGLSTFTIAPLKSYRIQNGKIGEPLKVATITGSVFETLSKIRGCSEAFDLKASAFGGCGKGEQYPLRVGMGGSAILVDDMMVG